MPSAYIDDGYTRDGYIDAVDRLYPAVRFSFRPVLLPELRVIANNSSQLDDSAPDRAEAVNAVAMAKHIDSWDIVNSEGKPVVITAAEVLRLQPSLYTRVRDIVIYGSSGGDADPEAASKATTTDDDADLDEALGTPDEDADAKN